MIRISAIAIVQSTTPNRNPKVWYREIATNEDRAHFDLAREYCEAIAEIEMAISQPVELKVYRCDTIQQLREELHRDYGARFSLIELQLPKTPENDTAMRRHVDETKKLADSFRSR